MENTIGMNLERNKEIINELTRGRDCAVQLQGLIEESSSPDTCELLLLKKIISSCDKAIIRLLSFNLFFGLPDSMDTSSPPLLGNNSPVSELSDADSSKQNCRLGFSKKRKTSPQATESVRVCSATGLGGALDDGHSWRKYGQKDILGATHPRAYYRCTHRFTKGCLATKHVQRSDEDPSVFEVKYKGMHTCIDSYPSLIQNPQFKLQESEENHDLILNSGLDQTLDIASDIFPHFSFPPSLNEHDEITEKENRLVGPCYPPPFASPTFSEELMDLSFLLDQHKDDFGLGQIMDESESDNLMIPTPSSVTNSPFFDGDTFDAIEFLENFS
ncbi:unnamed protein product [Cuscuta epithymum]|uniref:WRKY domain-containing protein n=2 Tax=Cuscuta epithymum TaxID=186058 RepID=A0AAV0DB13_9ASTE|nr:unnamed protein product [Cuscuta epithymum]